MLKSAMKKPKAQSVDIKMVCTRSKVVNTVCSRRQYDERTYKQNEGTKLDEKDDVGETAREWTE
jgi:hypothetical protein